MEITQPGGHIDHLLRQTRVHHVQLSAMADTKANMLLTISSVVITLSLRYVTDPLLRWPSIALMAFCLATIVLAAYAVMPKMSARVPKSGGLRGGPQAAPDIHSPNFNLLFFGNFGMLDYDEFARAMEDVINDPAKVYEAQVREVYTLGVYLARNKYRFIRWAYLTFILGLFVSGIVLALTDALLLVG
ncbi:MAG: Pycsar system effector family protein [Anaerolineales bacterium]